MSRPPRNGYTVNSDTELSALDSALVPANTPLINFDRKCWGIITAVTSTTVLSTPALTAYTAYRLESDGYYQGNLANINDGSFSSGVIALTPTNLFSVVTTFTSPQVLTSFTTTGGQFNGNYNLPSSVAIYKGSIVDASRLLGTFSITSYGYTEQLVPNLETSTTYLFVFTGTGTGQISLMELETKCSALSIVTSGGIWEYIPQNSINAYELTSITISTDTYSLDLATVTQYLSITLAANTTLSILNAGKYTKYFIELIPNGYIIKNFTDIFTLPRQYNQATLLTAYFGKQVLELQYVNKLYANIDYSDNITPAGTVATVQKINWAAPTSEILYLAFGASTTAYTGSGISAIAATVGTPTISKSRLLLGSTGRLEATKTVSLDFNETDFTISFFSAKVTAGNYGCILGSHKASSIGFYVGVAADSTLFAIFGSNVLSCALPDDIKEHSVVINRIGRIYKIFIDGVLNAHLKAANNFNSNSTEPLCIGSLKNATGTPSWTSQSWEGYLRQLTINTAASIPFSANDVPPKDPLTANTVLLLKFNVGETDLAQYNLTKSFTSNTTVQPLIASGRLNKYSHIGYTNSNLEITGNVTLEAKIYNPSGNTRGAIIDVEGGFTWGIYDLKLRIAFGSFTLDGVTDIPDSTVVDVAFVKSGTTCYLFLNGEIEATATTSEVMNAASSSSEFSIKRTYTQDTAIASLNTSLFRSRSWIEIAQLRVTKSARYTGNYIPDVFYGQ